MATTTEYLDEEGIWVIHANADAVDRHGQDFETALSEAFGPVESHGGGHVQLWIHEVSDRADGFARTHGAVPYRDVWQLRCGLPAAPSGLLTRPFTIADADAVIALNNRAFAWHPEQSGLTRSRLELTMAESWFDADGFRLYERDGHLVGFCWTKVHHELDPIVGEIYVIAIDPSAHGQGLGIPMTLAGLEWIAAKGIADALLYVESDNDPANASYRRIGFTHHHTDRAYNLTIAPPAGSAL